jgi:hypothetical protein
LKAVSSEMGNGPFSKNPAPEKKQGTGQLSLEIHPGRKERTNFDPFSLDDDGKFFRFPSGRYLSEIFNRGAGMGNPMIFGVHSDVKKHFYKYSCFLLMTYSLLAISLISCSHPSQNRRRIPEIKEPKSADQILSDMKTEVSLTDEQGVNIRPIIEEQVKKRKELIQKHRGQGRPGMDSLRDELKDLRINQEKQLQYFLTNEQMIGYGYMQQEEDQRIAGTSGGKIPEEAGQEKPKGKGRGLGKF